MYKKEINLNVINLKREIEQSEKTIEINKNEFIIKNTDTKLYFVNLVFKELDFDSIIDYILYIGFNNRTLAILQTTTDNMKNVINKEIQYENEKVLEKVLEILNKISNEYKKEEKRIIMEMEQQKKKDIEMFLKQEIS